jgi:hypothetical protein
MVQLEAASMGGNSDRMRAVRTEIEMAMKWIDATDAKME